MVRKADLEREISEMNKKYKLTDKGLHLGIHQAYGGYQVVLRGGKSLGSGIVDVTNGYDTATNTLNDLYKNDSKGSLGYKIEYYKKEGKEVAKKKSQRPSAPRKQEIKKR